MLRHSTAKDIIAQEVYSAIDQVQQRERIRMADSYEKIITELKRFMDDHPSSFWGGSHYEDWYVGIAQDADTRLRWHKALGVPHKIMTASSREIAAAVELHFVRRRGCAGESGGGPNANKVYAYRMKEGTTRE